MVLETVAAVPGMVGATINHLACLRRMCDDKGWIKTLMDEAENERMHLMTFIEISKPTVFERAVIIASGRQIELEDLPEAISRIALQEQDRIKVERARAQSEGRTTTFEVTVPSSMDEIERQAIEATLDYTRGDKTHAARALGIGRKTLYRKLDQYNGKGSRGETNES